MNRCGSFPLLSAPHSLFSIWTDLKRSEKIPRALARRWGGWIWLTGHSGLHPNSPQGLNISLIRVLDKIRYPEIPITLREVKPLVPYRRFTAYKRKNLMPKLEPLGNTFSDFSRPMTKTTMITWDENNHRLLSVVKHNRNFRSWLRMWTSWCMKGPDGLKSLSNARWWTAYRSLATA